MAYEVTSGPVNGPCATERAAGKTAPFRVFYLLTHLGKRRLAKPIKQFDAMWADTPEQAAEKTLRLLRELGRDGEVTRVHCVV